MCGRFVQSATADDLAEVFAVAPGDLLVSARYNLAPGAEVLAVRASVTGQRKLVRCRWGLVPGWAKDRAMAYRTINARAETVATKPAFRAAFRARRCLVPTDGFYEWRDTAQGKQPYFIATRDRRPFALAGLWEDWVDLQTGERLETLTIVVTDANSLIAEIHDRMPVILNQEDWPTWLAREVRDKAVLQPLLRPYPAERMTAYPVDRRVNAPKHDEPGLIEPLANL